MYLRLLPAAMLLTTTTAAWCAPTETVLYQFTGNTDGGYPHAGLIADSTGALYGSTVFGGTAYAGVIFKLTPPASGQTAWSETVLYNFTGGADGGGVYANLMMDKKGALYGTTISGGNAGSGVVFKLAPPVQGQTAWSQSVLYSFSGGNDGSIPESVLVQDSKGVLYGSTALGGVNGVGTVFKLSPPAAGSTSWAETVLHSFDPTTDGGVPFGGLVRESSGTLYGTTAGRGATGNGTIFSLAPPSSTGARWSYNVLYNFQGGGGGGFPEAGLITDSTGVFYGTTGGGGTSHGTVFKLTPPASGQTAWSETVLYRFTGNGLDGNGPWATVAEDSTGALYGTTLAAGASPMGSVFKLTPPVSGSSRWVESTLHSFKKGEGGQFPYSNLVVGANGTLFGTSFGSVNRTTGHPYPGTVFEITQ